MLLLYLSKFEDLSFKAVFLKALLYLSMTCLTVLKNVLILLHMILFIFLNKYNIEAI